MQCPKCGKQINDYAKFCEFCGGTTTAEQQTQNQQQQYQQPQYQQPQYPQQPPLVNQMPQPQVVYAQVYVQQPQAIKENSGTHTIRLVVGILSIVLFCFLILYSCNLGVSNAISDNGNTSGSGTFLLSLVILTAGIIAVAARRSMVGAGIASFFYLIACFFASPYPETAGLTYIALIFLFLLVLSITIDLVKKKKQKARANSGQF